MINLVICFPIASIPEINLRGWQDITTWSQRFQDFQVSLHPPLLHLVLVQFVISLVQSNPMDHMLDVWLQSRLVRGRRDRSIPDLEMGFLSSPTILWDSLTWTAFTEDLLMCPYTKYVNCSSCFITWTLMFQSSPIVWMLCGTWDYFPAF